LFFNVLSRSLQSGLISSCDADDFDKAVALEKAGKVKEAILLFEPLAAKGDEHAQVKLMSIYLSGSGVGRNRDKAEKYAIDCATGKKADYRCAEIVALIHWVGFGGPVDLNKASLWLDRAIKLGSPDAVQHKKDLLSGKPPQDNKLNA
jgi:TPR repeat protein